VYVHEYLYAHGKSGREGRKLDSDFGKDSRKAHDQVVGLSFLSADRSIEMAQLNPPQNEKTLTHIYVRDAQKGFVRPCWATGSEVYCGMCLRGVVQAVVGEVCPICSSTVERILEVAPGGAPKAARKRRDCSIRMEHQNSVVVSAVLLDFPGSRKARA